MQPSSAATCLIWSVRVAERLALPTSDHGVAGSNPAGREILPEPKRRFIAQSLSCSPFHRLEMTEILLKGRKTLTHPSNTCLIFGQTLRLLPYFMYANCEGSGETERMRSLAFAWAIAGRICVKYHNLISWLKYLVNVRESARLDQRVDALHVFIFCTQWF